MGTRTITLPPAIAPVRSGSAVACVFVMVARDCALLPAARARGRRHRLAAAVLDRDRLGLRKFLSFQRTPAGSIISITSFPARLTMIVLFTAIFTMMSVIEDRKEGFLLSVLVAPVSRSVIVLGKVLGGATLATLQGLIFLVFAPALGVHFTFASFGLTVLVVFLMAFSLTALGFIIAWPMDSTQAFHAIINLFLIPLWLLSGSLFPLSGASMWLRAVMLINPLTYGTEALRSLLFPGSASTGLSLTANFAVLALFTLVMFALSFLVANRRTTKPAA